MVITTAGALPVPQSSTLRWASHARWLLVGVRQKRAVSPSGELSSGTCRGACLVTALASLATPILDLRLCKCGYA